MTVGKVLTTAAPLAQTRTHGPPLLNDAWESFGFSAPTLSTGA